MFLDHVNSLEFEPFMIDHLVDPRGRYELDLDPAFPFAIRLYSFTPIRDRYPMNWHERLEIFVPVAGQGRFRMGDEIVPFAPGDALVVDNMKFHGLVDFEGSQRRAMMVTFAPQLVYSVGSSPCDFMYLAPFQCRAGGNAAKLPRDNPLATPVHGALRDLLDCYYEPSGGQMAQAGCKAHLLRILYYLSRHFQGAEIARSEYLKQQERAQRLARLFEHLKHHYARKITVAQAAAMVGMSESRFMKFFRQTTGTTFIAYLTQLRLTNACRLLGQTESSIADVASRVGFDDLAYFDRRFKQQFRKSPGEMRAQRTRL